MPLHSKGRWKPIMAQLYKCSCSTMAAKTVHTTQLVTLFWLVLPLIIIELTTLGRSGDSFNSGSLVRGQYKQLLLFALQNGKTKYAAFRAAVSFKGLSTTEDRDFLWDAFRQGSCKGGYNTTVWAVLADAVAAANLDVAYNSECLLQSNLNQQFNRPALLVACVP